MRYWLTVGLLFVSSLAHAVHVVSPEAKIDLDTEKVARIVGEINRESSFMFSLEMLSNTGLPGDRVILISSPGGEVDAGIEMLSAMEIERRSGVRMICVVVGQASSMAFNILTHCDVRLSVPKATMVVHKVAAGWLDPRMRLTAGNLRQLADHLDEIDEPFRRANAKAMHLSLVDYDLFADNETCWRAESLLKRHYLQGLIKAN